MGGIKHGLTGVEIGTTSICKIDGKEGDLFYRGHPIKDLVVRPFEDVAFLLLKGELPSERESRTFNQVLSDARNLPEPVLSALEACRDADPFVALQTAIGCLEIDDARPEDDPRWIGASASIMAHHNAIRLGNPLLPPDAALSHTTDFLRRLYGTMPSQPAFRAINADLVLHAEHGAAASTVAVRVAANQGASLRSAITAGLSCLSGPKHGGAVLDCGRLLETLETPEDAKKYVARAMEPKKGSDPVPGFGHRVYKVEDPRSHIYRTLSSVLVADSPRRNVVAEIATTLVEEMKPMRRFGIAPNDDLAAATLYNMLGLPSELYLSLFAISRITGWIAHFREAQHLPNIEIPELAYAGPTERTIPNGEG